MKVDMMYVIIFLASVFVSSVSQIILKKSANKTHENKLQEYLNLPVITAYGLFFGSSLLTVLAYKGVPLSLGPILEATGYIWVAVLGTLFLKEKISKQKMLGMAIIIAGIILFNIA